LAGPGDRSNALGAAVVESPQKLRDVRVLPEATPCKTAR